MAFNRFNKNLVVGVSVSPELGLEVAQIDFATKTVLKYGNKQLGYDNLRKEVADLDLFKETLADLLMELAIPKGSEIVLNIPSILFKVADYPASIDETQLEMTLEEELVNHPIFQNNEASISAVRLPISTIQNNKIAYTAAQKVMLIEICMQIKSLGYTVVGIDTSVNSILNALIYNDRVDIAADSNWVLLIVDNNTCRILSMLGKCYADSFEEKIAIGEVLGDAENYGTVISAVTPILKNVPSKRLYVLSKTNAINAEVLASKLTYNGQIIHHNDNIFAEAPYLETAPDITDQAAKMISLDVIGAAINKDFGEYSLAPMNLFNASLGSVWADEQPLQIVLGGHTIYLTLQSMIVASAVFAVIAIIAIMAMLVPLKTIVNINNDEISKMDAQIAAINAYLEKNKNVSAENFNEGTEIKLGLQHNKNIYTYYTVVGTEIPKKLWLTHLNFGEKITIEGQADNLESVYSFFRNIKDYNPASEIKLQKLGLATKSKLTELAEDESFDTDSIITSMNADFYEFRISDAPEEAPSPKASKDGNGNAGADGLPNVELSE